MWGDIGGKRVLLGSLFWFCIWKIYRNGAKLILYSYGYGEESMFNFLKKKVLNHKSSDFEELIKYGIEMSGKENVNVSSYQLLIYLQKVICNSISYNDYVYRILQSPQTAPRVELADFLPTNSNYTYINLEKPIYINAKDNPRLTLPWHHNRVVNNILTIGEDAGNPIDTYDINIDNMYHNIR